MNSPLLCCDLAEIAPLTLPRFARDCAERLAAGEQLLALYGRTDSTNAGGLVVTAVFLASDTEAHPLRVLRAQAHAGEHYPALTARFPAAQIHERELWEQTGLVPDGHPWLKPVRFEGERQQRMTDYPFFSVRGTQVHEVGVGPIHAGIIEPGHFRFMCLGETVHHLEIQLGYQHRGVEQLLLRRPALALTPLVESACGDTCVANAAAYCNAVETLAATPADFGTKILRAIAIEMERVAVHLATLNGLATDIAFVQGTGSYGRLRTAMINASQRASGNRFGRGWLRPGRARGIDDTLRADLSKTFADTARDLAGINGLMLSAHSVGARFKGTGKVSRQAAIDLGLVGLAARASGVADDLRGTLPGSVHARFPLATLIESDGDCWARMQLRMREIDASLTWLQALLADNALDLEGGHWSEPPASATTSLRPEALCISLAEGPRGRVLHAIETTADSKIAHYKLQDPSLANWFGLALALRDTPISDFPICNKSFDLSYCGNDL